MPLITTAMSPSIRIKKSQDRKDEKKEEDCSKQRAKDSLESIIFVFQALMALALTNGAFVFFTQGGNAYLLHPVATYSMLGILIFTGFILMIILFIHGDVLILRETYRDGFTNRGMQPICDFFILFTHSVLFYILSLTFGVIKKTPLTFFVVIGILLAINVAWACLSIGFNKQHETYEHHINKQKILSIYAFQNSAILFLGIILAIVKVSSLELWLALLLFVRNIIDISLTYHYFFPDAFHTQTKSYSRKHRRYHTNK